MKGSTKDKGKNEGKLKIKTSFDNSLEILSKQAHGKSKQDRVVTEKPSSSIPHPKQK